MDGWIGVLCARCATRRHSPISRPSVNTNASRRCANILFIRRPSMEKGALFSRRVFNNADRVCVLESHIACIFTPIVCAQRPRQPDESWTLAVVDQKNGYKHTRVRVSTKIETVIVVFACCLSIV